MKKLILATASVLALFSTAHADSNFKSGFKVGGGVGYKHHRVKNVSNYDASALGVGSGFSSESFSKSGADNTVQFQLHTGYDLIINRFLAAVEFDYRYNPGEVTMNFNTVQTDPVNPDGLGRNDAPYEVKQKHKHDFGLSARLGGLITENFALYAIGNVRLGKFKHQFINNKGNGNNALLVSNSKSQSLWGFGGGIGTRYAFSKGVTVAFETTYDVYQKIKFNSDEVAEGIGIGAFSTQSKRPHIFSAMFKLSKTF